MVKPIDIVVNLEGENNKKKFMDNLMELIL
jgi:hypothetical protein